MRLVLYKGNLNYSSWSLRAVLCARQTGLSIEEQTIPLDEPGTAQRLAAVSPSGRVPVLHAGELVVWDSLAIIEWLNEAAPAAGLWPAEPRARAVARSVAAEMHAGFAALRGALPMDLRARRTPVTVTPATRADIARIVAIWADCRVRFGSGGDFLFGAWSAADALYAPVVSRFLTYGIPLTGAAAAYAEAAWAWPGLQQALREAGAEPWTLPLEILTADGPRQA